MAAVQLSFSLRTSSNVRTVHLLGSWDNYAGQLPLSKDTKPGAWKGTFRFQNSVLAPGKRYWYYVCIQPAQRMRSLSLSAIVPRLTCVESVHRRRLPRISRSCQSLDDRANNWPSSQYPRCSVRKLFQEVVSGYLDKAPQQASICGCSQGSRRFTVQHQVPETAEAICLTSTSRG